MSLKRFEIDREIKQGSRRLEAIETIEVDDTVYTVLSRYKELFAKQKEQIRELGKFKERELDAFAIGDAISDGICMVDDKGIVTAINKGYTEITGLSAKEIIGEHIQTLMDKGYFNRAVSLMVMQQKKKVSSLSTIAHNNKKVLITGKPFFNENGEFTHSITVMRDLTELIHIRDKLEKAEKESEKYLNELNFLRNIHRENSSMIGENRDMQKLKELIGFVAKTDTTILITGETGSGKEVVSREIHNRSNRSEMPYIKVNCSAIPETLIESELFGYEKGAFTGALNKEKLGMFELANKGTILLDEISEMPMNLQAKLLRVLQEKEIIRVGGTKSIKLDVRIIAATNQDLQELIHKSRFREDLFYRLNVVPIRVPPLRERKDDIPILSNSFLEKFNYKYSKEKSFDSGAIQALSQYNWPGNIRELENVIERLVVTDDEKLITFENIIDIIGKDKLVKGLTYESMTLKEAVETLEREMIEASLRKYGSTHKAAGKLGVTQSTVSRKARALGIRFNEND
ncbi:MAG: sigma 54-interacting transcriptional regulator [Clostridiales bacterium]|nr:sigma 54-interacting transcriptional regulator [Clostridiales bacterium]